MKKALINTAVLAIALIAPFYVLTQLLFLSAHHGPLPLSAAFAALAGLAACAAMTLPVAFYRAVRHEDGGK
jgi:multidrug transporter EmrE-like cation transporter